MGLLFPRIECNHSHGATSERDLNQKSVSNTIKRKTIVDTDERPTNCHKEVEQQRHAVNTYIVPTLRLVCYPVIY